MKKAFVLFFALLAAGSLFADVEVKAVKGLVGVKTGAKLQPVKVGNRLKDDATVVTGANSEVSLIVNNGTITLKSLTTAKLRGVSLTKAASVADVALRNGTVVSEVKQITGLKTSFTVTTPVGTSSVRGTTHTISYSRERGMAVSVAAGSVSVSSRRGGNRPVAAGLSYAEGVGAGSPQVTSQAAAAAAVSSAAALYAPAEEVSPDAGSGSAASADFELVEQLANKSNTGKVQLSLLFP